MKSIVELINEVNGMDEQRFAERLDFIIRCRLIVRLDFDNWLRRCVEPGRQFVDMKEAWDQYEKSFG